MTHHTERLVSTAVLGVRDVGQRAGHYFVLAFDFFPRLKLKIYMFLLIFCFFKIQNKPPAVCNEYHQIQSTIAWSRHHKQVF